MSRFVKTLALFVAGLQLAPAKAFGGESVGPRLEGDDDSKGVSLQPLNGKFDNLFAGHTSHSSHRSHASHSSHYSGSSGYASPYAAPSPAPASAPMPSPVPSPAPELTPTTEVPAAARGLAGSAPTSNGNGGVISATPEGRGPVKSGQATSDSGPAGSPSSTAGVPMTLAEKLRLQVIRVQIRLNSLGLYNGQISGTLDPETRAALKLFQKVKNLPESGQMTTPTLNALGIPAVK